ncbi:META domain-containing protein [Miniimonas sp. S16]|uniref:META domain-containing protein n=1 Tax=Miniimonas sp. S16 TaxID=2171623 RepID=UPI000D5296B4|nr:META domain-containing protein [Miniimonas sp. S16]
MTQVRTRPTTRRRSLATVSLAVVLGASVLAACASGGSGSGGATAEALSLEGSWTLVSGSGPDGEITPVDGAPITLMVDGEGAVSGKDGCNNIVSTVTVDGDTVTFAPIASTMMACEQPIMDVATAYGSALGAVTTGDLDGEQLVLTGPDIELTYDQA